MEKLTKRSSMLQDMMRQLKSELLLYGGLVRRIRKQDDTLELKGLKMADVRKKTGQRGAALLAGCRRSDLSEAVAEIGREMQRRDKGERTPGPPSAYEKECAQPLLKGCLLPAEPVPLAEEFMARAKSCPQPTTDCNTLAARVRKLQEQHPALRQTKNENCTGALKEERCPYRYRQLEAVIEAQTINELMYERFCFN